MWGVAEGIGKNDMLILPIDLYCSGTLCSGFLDT